MKKILCVILVLGLASCSWADDVGFLARLKTTPEEFFMLMKSSWATKGWVILGGDHSSSKARFYDSLSQMQMGMGRGEIDEMILPDFVAEYIAEGQSRLCTFLHLQFPAMTELTRPRSTGTDASSSSVSAMLRP